MPSLCKLLLLIPKKPLESLRALCYSIYFVVMFQCKYSSLLISMSNGVQSSLQLELLLKCFGIKSKHLSQ